MHAELMEAREATEEAIAIITVRIDGLYHGRIEVVASYHIYLEGLTDRIC